jgi:hypothetical protein
VRYAYTYTIKELFDSNGRKLSDKKKGSKELNYRILAFCFTHLYVIEMTFEAVTYIFDL